jgi:diguanylate cyclase (GGDEF)-like protein
MLCPGYRLLGRERTGSAEATKRKGMKEQMKDIRILLIEDNPDDVELLKELLLDAHCSLAGFVHVDELSAALELLQRESFKIVLLDMSLPDSSGPGTFYKLHEIIPETPMIVITGNRDEKIIGDLLQNGAQDYLIKGAIDPDALIHSINHAIERQRLLVSLNQKTREIQSLRESLEHIVGNNADAIMVIDQQGKTCFANPAAAEIFNCRQEDLMGRNFGFPIVVDKALELDVVCKDGKATVAEMRAVEITWENRPAYLASIRNITERKQFENEIIHVSFHDQLTGLYNRAFFNEELKRLDVERNLPLCLIMGDLNNLKLINDALGHSEGDRLLVAIAQILKISCRKDDIVARLGGDEFVALLPKCDETTAMRIINNIKTACKGIVSNSIPASIALGFALKSEPGQPISTILDLADSRMYASKFAENRSTCSSFITTLENSLYEKDYITAEHAMRVHELSTEFGARLRLNDNIIDELTVLASLHDIGKIAIPESILKKKEPLTAEEWEIIKKHPETGYRITGATHGMNAIAEDILYHHERWDGRGYPQGLKGEQIPLASRILAIIDTFDVMTHDRPYKKAVSEREAVIEIKSCSGSQFDPKLVAAFIIYHDPSSIQDHV